MELRPVVAASVAALVAVGGGALAVRLAFAAPPAGYKCGKGGKKNTTRQRCDCPKGKHPSRDDATDEAICKRDRRHGPDDDRGVGAVVTPAPAPSDEPRVQAARCPADMVAVPGATFMMGSPDGVGDIGEHPQHQVTLSPYCIDRTEVTVAAYAACATCTSAATTVEWPNITDAQRTGWNATGACNGEGADRRNYPANCITWMQADFYCRAVGKRLPTDAEWELAAKGTDGRMYPWGNKDPSPARLNACGTECRTWAKDHGMDYKVLYEGDDGYPLTAPVGSFPDGASPYGALDMAGNVWEWVADESVSYGADAVTDPRPATTSAAAVDKKFSLRGGGWYNFDTASIRAPFRGWKAASVRISDLGFRCARGL